MAESKDVEGSQVERRRFLKYLGSGVAGAAVASAVGASAYLSSQSEVQSLRSQTIPRLQEDLKKSRDELSAAVKKSKEQESSLGFVGYTFGRGYAASIDLNLGKLLAVSRSKVLEDNILSYSNHRVDHLGRVWGGSGSTGEVFVLDPATLGVQGKVQLPGRWRYLLMDISPDGKFAYVLNLLEVKSSVKDEDLRAPRPKVEISDIVPSHVHKIDTSSLKLVSSLEVVRFACDVDITPDGRYLWLPNQLDKLMTQVDLETFTVKQHIEGQIGGSMVTVSPDRKWLFVEVSPSHTWGPEAIKGEDSEVIIDAETGKIVKNVPLEEPPGIDEISPDGRYAIVTMRTKVAIFDTNTLNIVARVPINGPGTLSFSPDSKYAYIPSRGDKAVQVVDLQTFQVIRSLKVPEPPSTIVPIDLKRYK